MKTAKGFQDMFRVYGKNPKGVLDGYVKREPKQQIDFKKDFDFSLLSSWPEAQKLEYLSSSLLVPMDLLQNDLTPTAVVLYSLICEDAVEENNELVFRGNRSYFERRLNFSTLTAIRTLKKLEEVGFIKKEIDIYNRASGETITIYPLKDFFLSSSESIQICNGLFYNSRFSPALMLAYGYIFSNYNKSTVKSKDDGFRDFPIGEELKILGMTRSSLFRYLNELNNMGVIEIYEKPGSPHKIKALVDFHQFFLNYEFPNE